MSLCPAVARAQEPSGPTLGPPSPASAGVLTALPPPNLRLTIACADDPFLTSGDGLEVTLDGQHAPLAGTTDYLTAPELTRRGGVVAVTVPVDVGYVVPSGAHQLRIAAPGCEATTRDVEIPAAMPLVLDGALPTTPGLRGPSDAPNGATLALGGFYSSFPQSLASGPTSAAVEPGQPVCDWGAELTASYNVAPTDLNGSTLLLSAGILWQPAAACSREPFLRSVGEEHAPPASQ